MVHTDLKQDGKYNMEVCEAFRVIASFKWRDGYACLDCGSNEYTKGSKPYSRRCIKTDCRTDESPTARTAFDGIKTENVPAFLGLLRLLFSSQERVSPAEQRQYLIDKWGITLRPQTVTAFVNKVSGLLCEPRMFDDHVHLFTYKYDGMDRGRIAVMKGLIDGIQIIKADYIPITDEGVFSFIARHAIPGTQIHNNGNFNHNIHGTIRVPKTGDEIAREMNKWIRGARRGWHAEFNNTLCYASFRMSGGTFEDMMVRITHLVFKP